VIYRNIFLRTFFIIFFIALGYNFAEAQQREKDTTLVTVMPEKLYDRSVFVTKPLTPYTSPFRRKRSGLVEIPAAQPKIEIKFDPKTAEYLVTQSIDGVPIGVPVSFKLKEFTELSREAFKKESLARLAQTANNRRQSQQGLIDFKFSVPGGKESVFTTIFGKPEVNLRVTGTANMNVGAAIQRDENPSVPEDQRQRVDPTFEQNLKLNIQGGIGDKLTINTDWDTERPFDYQNRLRIAYTGYEDEIIKSIELGNVGMETGNSLISGGQALFGIKSVAQLGALKVTSVISQKEGTGNSKSIDGGSTEETFRLNPTDYEDDRHFYIDYFTYDRYDEALSNPINQIALYNINQLVVYKLNLGTQRNENFVQGVAISDLGVVKNGLTGRYEMPNTELDKIDDEYLNDIRTATLDTIDVVSVANRLGVESQNVVKGFWIPLQLNVDYIYDKTLGTISLLNSALQSNEALAIAFQNQSGSTIQEVGDVNVLGEQILILKLIRQQNINPQSTTWDLTMRNVYSLGPSNISSDGFQFNLYFTGSNVPLENIPGIPANLLQLLGLDRVNLNREITPDNLIDFSTGVIDGVGGKIYFPYTKPFGERIIEIIEQSAITDKEKAIEEWSFPELYSIKQGVAKQESKRNLFEMSGTVKGGTSGSFYLGYALVEGSVKVFANGVELQEGLDFEVDYSIGNVYITNTRYLAKGQKIKVDYESNNIVQIQQTTFTGVRGEYQVSDNIKFGATYFNLKDNPLTDKIRIGDEPINNSVYGFDAKAKFEAPWLTKALDFLPLIETKAPSSINFSGEFAQLKPGVAQTNAVQAAIDANRLYPDEEQGVSFIDEFEGSKTSFNFASPTRWSLAAAPAAIPGYDTDLGLAPTSLLSKIERSDMRSQFAWYTIPINVSSIIDVPRTRETRLIQVSDVFDRQTLQQDNFLNTLDIYYNPTTRGQYNYNRQLKNLLENEPDKTWGGMTTTLPQGLENLTLNNIEFIEFWVQPIIPDSILKNGSNASAAIKEDYRGKIYIDLGTISEDLIPNFSSNNEDGLAQGGAGNLNEDQQSGIPPRSLVLRRPIDYDGQFSINSLEDEDVGLDGIPNNPGLGGYNETDFFQDFVASVQTQYGTNHAVTQAVFADPSNDDYYYWAESAYTGKSLQERFLRMFGYSEENSRTTGEKRAITNRPDAEGLIIPTAPNTRDSYYQYEIDLNPADPNSLSKDLPYIVDITEDRNEGSNWYQIRIPLETFKRKFGDVQDFQSVTHMRFWMSGYKKPFTLRFATFELVGSQWRKAEAVGNFGNTSTDFLVSTINVEENKSRRPVPYVTPNGAIRAINRTQQGNLLANEQALSIQVNDLRGGDLRMIRRNFTGGMNLINYSNLRMFVHAEGFDRRGQAELIVRMGRDLEREYYEYRQPLTPTDTSYFVSLPRDYDEALQEEIEQRVWLPEENAMNIVLSSLNSLKQLRNLAGVDPSVTYYDSTLVRDAPPGTRIGIKGNPSLQNISEIGIGVMNPARLISDGSTQNIYLKQSLDANIWVNELRVSGFDNDEGWAANASANVQLADIGSINGKILTSRAGYGSLDSRLGNRQRADRLQYDFGTTFNLHKLLPQKYGWNIPIGFNYNNSLSTPQFLPREGDIRLSDFTDAVRSQEVPIVVQDSLISAKLREVQDFSERYSFTLSNLSKRNSDWKLLQYTLDNLNTNYSYSQEKRRNVNDLYKDSWNFNAGLSFSYTFKKVDLLRPFWFTEDISWLSMLYDFQLGYMPTSINMSGTLSRSYQEWQRRSLDATVLPILQTHQFDFNQTAGFSYNLTPTIPISFSSQSKYFLNSAGEKRNQDDPKQPFELVPTFKALENVFKSDSAGARQESYTENYGISWRPQINKIKSLNFLSYSTTYRGGFRWQNSPQGSNQGASIGNSYNLDQNVGIKIQEILKKIPFYDNLKKADDKESRERARLAAAEKRKKENEMRLELMRKKNPNAVKNAPKPTSKPADKKEEDREGNILYLGRKLGLAIFSMQNFDVNYGHAETSAQNGYAGNSSIFNMFNTSADGNSFSPPFMYRVGLTRMLNDVVTNPFEEQSWNITMNETFQDNFTMTSKFQPFKNFSVDLDWNFGWNKSVSRLLILDPLSNDGENQINETGDISSSVWAFGGDFSQFFRKQLQRGLDDYNTTDRLISDVNGNGDGLTILDRDAIQKDFVQTYLANTGSGFGKNGYMPFPLPNWKINWSGLEDLFPFLDDYVTRITLNHSYSGSYRTSWKFNPNFGEELSSPLFQQSPVKVITEIQEYEASALTIDRRFMPVIGLNITWKNNVSTRLQYDYSKLLTMSTSNPTMTEKTSQGFKFTGTWQKRGFRLPFFNKLRNTLDLSVSASYYEEANLRRQFTAVLANSLVNGLSSTNADDYDFVDNSDLGVVGDTRIKLTGLVGYQFSSMVKANFEYTYDHAIPKSTQTFERVTQNIRFNVIVTIRSN